MSRYLVKCPLSLERLEILDVERVRYSAKDSREGELKKVYEIDPLQCPKCGGSMKIKAFIHDPEEISRICESLGLPDWRAPPKMGKDRKFQVPDLEEFSF